VLDGVTAWMQVNGEAIYETRPWKVHGEGPHSVKSGSFQGNSVSSLGPKDIRFTRNKAGNVVYVWCWLADGSNRRAVSGNLGHDPPGKVARVNFSERATM